MEVSTMIEVVRCYKCPFRDAEPWVEGMSSCGHEDGPGDVWLHSAPDEIPADCPLRKGPTVIRIGKVKTTRHRCGPGHEECKK